ncbi:tetrapyrrole methylase [Absidia repens]|uniref:Tetrapyrrole methylase n=1 Tax=Absidia repens TaxID=90262 RepID=A0A1X2IAC7_9FUNG|nr:tetrapyrrole methylase [Absidia repens]
MNPSSTTPLDATLPSIPQPQGGASLMVAFQCQSKKMLVVGSNHVAASQVLTLLEADALVTLVGDQDTMVPELTYRIQQQQVHYAGHHWDASLLAAEDDVQMVFVCPSSLDEKTTVDTIVQQCRQRRVPVNVTDRNDLSDFLIPSTYRDQSLQIAVSTNGQAPKLANRIRRHVISGLPANLGQAVHRVGTLHKQIQQQQSDDNGSDTAAAAAAAAATTRRMNWLAQISEYWSMERLAQLSDADMHDLLETYQDGSDHGGNQSSAFQLHSADSNSSDDAQDQGSHKRKRMAGTSATEEGTTLDYPHGKMGTITLVGSGPGDPELLTLAAHRAIREADLVLSDKIVPAEVVAMVECELKIARKFPGNADAAQDEFNALALVALQQGKKVVRLKQGDPFLFGRGGEEVIFFRKHGYTTKVIPGISSAVAGPLLAGIPLTHRSVASQFLVTTGTGRKGESLALPVYEPSRTDVFLMAIHRLDDLVADLVGKQNYPADLSCAIVERASCIDQRTVYGTLTSISKVLQSVGGSRPPGLLVTGHAIDILKQDSLPVEGVIKDLLMDGRQHSIHSERLQLHDPEGVS